MRRCDQRFRSAGGFTLLEMMIVLVVAGIVVAVAVPSFQPAITGMQLRSAAQDVASGLRHVRGHALATGREQVFTLNVTNHWYRVSGRKKTYGLPGSVKLDLFTADQEISEDGQGGTIRFYPDGSATGGRVTLSASGRKFRVDVNWLTGAIAVREDHDEDG
jgi:general secretion pathway protein H